jgi:sec-independent protein translocase protein TatA
MNLYIISTLFSGEHLLLIIAAIVFLFGGKKIPELMGGIGKGMKEFKKAMKEDETPVKKEESKEIAVSEVKPAASDLNA